MLMMLRNQRKILMTLPFAQCIHCHAIAALFKKIKLIGKDGLVMHLESRKALIKYTAIYILHLYSPYGKMPHYFA